MNPADCKAIDVGQIRKRFPALTRVHRGCPVAYFDAPGGTQVPTQVAEAMLDYLYRHNANTGWSYPTSRETDEAIAHARKVLGHFLNASPREVIFGANMTTLAFHLAWALGRRFGAGDEVVISDLEHHSNVAPWRMLARDHGVTVRTVKMDRDTGQWDWDDFERQLGPRTRFVAITAASNVLGTVNHVRRAARLAHAVNALLFVDAVHYAAHFPIDVQAFECDFLTCSAYKFYGPHVGVMFGREDILDSLEPVKLVPAPDEGPERWEIGTQNHEGIVGAGAAVEFLASLAQGATVRERVTISLNALHETEMSLAARLWEGLSCVKGLRLFAPRPEGRRTPLVIFTMEGQTSSRVAEALAARGIFVSHGNFYAPTLVERLTERPDGLVRAGCACYTSAEDIERFIDAAAAVGAGG